MKKREFLAELRKRLAGLSEADMKQPLDYYEEMVDDRIEEGLSEEEAVKAVGTPAEIAGEILGEMPLAKLVKVRVKPNRKLSVGEIVLLVLGSPIWFSLLLTAFVIVPVLYIVLWLIALCLWAAELTLGAGAVVGVLALPLGFVQGNGWAGIALLGVGLFSAGLSILGFHGCLCVTKGLCILSKKIFQSIKFRFIRKEAIK